MSSQRIYKALHMGNVFPAQTIRKARHSHRCNGTEEFPGCGREIAKGSPYLQATEYDPERPEGTIRFCRVCAGIIEANVDLFE